MQWLNHLPVYWR